MTRPAATSSSSESARMCSASAKGTRSGSSSSVSARSNKSSSTRRPRSAAESGPASSKRLPRLLMRMPSWRSIWRRCSSNWPPTRASRRGSSGVRTTVSDGSAVFGASGNGLVRLAGNEATSQAVSHGFGDDDVGELADERSRADEVDPALILGAARELARVLLRLALDEDALHRADHAGADRGGLLVDERLQPREPLLLDLVWQVLERGGRRSGPRAVDEAERLIEADRANQRERLLEVLFGLAGIAHDEVRRQRDAGAHGLQLLDLRNVLLGRVAALHELQDAVRAALHRQVQVARELRHRRVGADERVRELRRMRRRETDALDAVNLRDAADQRREIHLLAAAGRRPFVRVDVLSEQRDLARAERGEPPRFREHVLERPADLLAARDWHDAIRARLAT